MITITLFSGLPRHRKQSRRTTRARTGFYIAGAAASPKKPTSRRARLFSDMTDTPKNVTASGNAGKSGKPPTGSRSTGNYGLILWGNVGTGKSYFAGCIANALMEREISVCMTNFSLILNDLAANYKDRNEYIARLCSFPLLILDDFGMERGTEYGLEQVYNVIDSRYRSRKPLIVTTNLTLEELQNPEDTPHARIYDRLIEMCTPVRITGENFRKARAREKMERLKKLLNGKEICL